MKETKKSICLRLEKEVMNKLLEHQSIMKASSMTQTVKNLIMNRAYEPKASDHLLALCNYSVAVIVNLEYVQNLLNISEEEKLGRLKELNRYKARINRILRKYNY